MTDYKKLGYESWELTRKYPSAKGVTPAQKRKTLHEHLPRLALLTSTDIAPFEIVERIEGWATEKGIQSVDEREEARPGANFVKERNNNAFCIFKPGAAGYTLENGINMIVAHIDNPNLRVRTQPTYFEWDPEKKHQHPGPYLEVQPYGGINAPDWVNKTGMLSGRFYKNGIERRIHLTARIPHTSIHFENDEQEDNSFNRVRVFTGATSVKELYAQLGIKSEEEFGSAEIYFYPKTDFTVFGNYVTAYGLDDRACVAATTLALLETNPEVPTFVFGLDCEEIGSTGPAGKMNGFVSNVLSKYLSKLLDSKRNLPIEELYNKGILGTIPAICADVDGVPGYNEDEKPEITPLEAAKFGFGPFICPSWSSWGSSNNVSGKDLESLENVLKKVLPGKYQWIGSVYKSGDAQHYSIAHFAEYFTNQHVPMIPLGIPVGDMHRPGGELMFIWDFLRAKQAYEAYITNPATR